MAAGEMRAATVGGAARTIAGGRSVRRTPHLASPLLGGRDELGEGVKWRRAQAGTNHPNAPTNTHQANSPKKIHPSPLLGGRLGGGWEATSVRGDRARPGRLSRHSPPPLVIPAQAGTCAPTAIPAPPSSVIPAQAGMRARRLRSQPQATGGAAAQRWRAVGMLGGAGMAVDETRAAAVGGAARTNRWWSLGAPHPPPSLPPKRGEG